MSEGIPGAKKNEKQQENSPERKEILGEWVIREMKAPSSEAPSFSYSDSEYASIRTGPSWKLLVERGNQRKWIDTDKQRFHELKEGDLVTLPLKQWENENEVERISAQIRTATDFKSLETILNSLGEIEGPERKYTPSYLIEQMEYLKEGKIIALSSIPEVYGLKEQAKKLANEYLEEKRKNSLLQKLKNLVSR